MKKEVKNQRLQSLDALRGFDMFFIMGGGALFVGLATWCPTPFFQAIASQMEHVPWHGFAFEDMIFPLFLFIAGISFPYSLEKQKASGMTSSAIYRKVIRRGLVLVLLGCIYNGLLDFDFANQRYASVLGRIGLAWMFAALIFLNVQTRVRIGIVALIGTMCKWSDPFSKCVLIDRGLDHNSLETQRVNEKMSAVIIQF